MMKYKVVLWGMGTIYNRFLNTIRLYESKGEIEIEGVTSKDIPPYKRIDGYRIFQPSELNSLRFDYIIIMNERAFFDIYNYITVNLGVKSDIVLSYRMFQIPNLVIEKYIALKREGLTIFSNNCWGGMVYQLLGFECISPLRNCFMLDEDYFKFLLSPKHYLEINPSFLGFEKDKHKGNIYPVIEMDDVKVHCNHETDPDHAISEWERRKNRVNLNSVFTEMFTESRATEAQFEKMVQYERRICFVPWETDCKHSLQLDMLPYQCDFYETVNLNAGNGGWRYDIVTLLLTGKIQSRVEV